FDALPRVEFASRWVTAALKDRAYVVRDREARPLELDDDPAYDLVHLVTRYPDRYAGFHVRSTSRRRQVAFLPARGEAAPIPVADPLVGSVRSPYLVSLLEQRPREEKLREERRATERSDSYRELVLDHLSLNWQASESMGGRGLEGAYDQELSGRSGYRESSGLQDRQAGRAPIFVEAVDGEDITTTLDLDLQRAAQATIDFPAPPPAAEAKPDRVWHQRPVGAIVLITVEGEVLAAASGPSAARAEWELGLYQDDQGLHSGDRTLRQHTFQPPGSILKPFVAAWALDRGLDAKNFSATCAPREQGALGSHREGATVHCHGIHWENVHLRRALLKSCNSFFAKVGEELYDGPGFREMARSFGFDRSVFGDQGRPAGRRLKEDWHSPGFFRDEDEARVQIPTQRMLQRLGNGLTHLSVTPLQVARAYSALATGRLPELRLVRRIGEREQLAVSSPLPISAESLEIVRAALRRVAIEGTAADRGLDAETLGFSFACKTGSADYITEGVKVPEAPQAPISDALDAWKPGERKHGWVAGWFPAEDPVAVAVVYVHDTSTTSSHVATHVMSQFLRADAVVHWLREQGR
ncbi:MAG: penicillin-binding transpeptidase domain-containing protein, partial [Planctomycetota bacterium]